MRLPQVLAWLDANFVDVPCLQEVKRSDDKFPVAALQAAATNGYFINGQAPVSDKFADKMQWISALHDQVRAELAACPAWCWQATSTWP